jgi:hypothetical protein
MKRMTRECGTALMIGGALFIVLNAVFTPMMPTEAGEEAVRTSLPYLIRLSLAVAAAIAYILGTVGVRLAQGETGGRFDRLAFWIAILGNCLLLGLEWSNVFVLRPLAQVAPEALDRLDAAPLLTAGFAAGAGLFSLGWILLAVSAWRTMIAPRWAPITILVGFGLTVALGASPLRTTGMIIGSVVIGAGMIGLGRGIRAVSA